MVNHQLFMAKESMVKWWPALFKAAGARDGRQSDGREDCRGPLLAERFPGAAVLSTACSRPKRMAVRDPTGTKQPIFEII